MVLAKHADSMLRERDRLLTEVNEASRRLEIQKATIEDIEKKRMDLENKNKELCKILDVGELLMNFLAESFLANNLVSFSGYR